MHYDIRRKSALLFWDNSIYHVRYVRYHKRFIFRMNRFSCYFTITNHLWAVDRQDILELLIAYRKPVMYIKRLVLYRIEWADVGANGVKSTQNTKPIYKVFLRIIKKLHLCAYECRKQQVSKVSLFFSWLQAN